MGPVPSLHHSSMQALMMLVLLLRQMGMMQRMLRRPGKEPKTLSCEKARAHSANMFEGIYPGASSIPAVALLSSRKSQLLPTWRHLSLLHHGCACP